jgi:PhnB protein
MASRAARKSKTSKAAVRAAKRAPAKKKVSKPARSKRPAPARKRSASAQALAAATPAYHTVTPFLTIKGADRAIDFYKQAFGAQERARMPGPDGSIMHAELVIGDSTIMLSDAVLSPETRSSMHVYVDDCDTMFERAVAAGGTVRMPMQDMFWGDRYGQVEDPFGNIWSIATHKEDIAPEEMARRVAEASQSFSAAVPTE